ncbi:hypothetical protein ABIB35_000995 [Arthrobacter sp. UYP6]|uniref:hypothetical protein n=1 Tax=Arthrobacter sp. UYP6 TaxID=1756378 RepID=UPI00339B4BB7
MSHSAGRAGLTRRQSIQESIDEPGNGGGPRAEARHDRRRKGRNTRHQPTAVVILIALALGIFSGLAGLAPWIGTGRVLPLQNLWAVETLPDDMPLTWLPLNQYMAIRLVALMVFGGMVAGLALHWWAPIRRRTALWSAVTGMLVVQVSATVQSFNVLDEGLEPGSMSELYSDGLLAGVAAAILVAVLVLLAVGSRSTALVALGIGAAAVPTGSWLLAWGEVFWPPFDLPAAVPQLAQWFPAVLVGLALAWCPPNRIGRAAVWVLDLALLLTVPALFDAVAGALGTRVFRGDLVQMQESAASTFAAGLGAPEAVGAVLLAAAVGVTGAAIRALVRRAA